MSAPNLPKRVAVEHHLGLTPAIGPQIHKRKRLPPSHGPAPYASPPGLAPLTRPSPLPPAAHLCEPAQTAPWLMCLQLKGYRLTMGFGQQVVSRLPRMFQRSPYTGGISSTPTRTDVPPSGDFPVGSKQKFMLANGERMSVLTDAAGKRYVVSQGQGRGGYGKLRVAMDFEGHHFAVKEMRLSSRSKEGEAGASESTRRHTKVSSSRMIREEVAMMAAASRSMTVHACFEVQGKVYLFLPLMADDATTLATGTPAFVRVAVGRQIFLRACEDLAAIHQRGYLHHDVKLHNILWNAAGSASLADFGLSCKIDETTGTTRAPGRTAGNMPMEYELGVPFSWSLDTFMLGLAMADYYAPQVRERPATGKSVAALEALESWRHKVMDIAGRVDPERVGKLHDLSYDEGTWDAYFAKVCELDPALGAFIIERMLNRHAAARASLAEVRAFVAALQPPGGQAAEAAVQVMHTIADNDWDRQRLLRHMRWFRRRIGSHTSPPIDAAQGASGSSRSRVARLRASSRLGRAWQVVSAASWRKPPKREPKRRLASTACE